MKNVTIQSKFITLHRSDDDIPMIFNTAHIIDVEPQTEWTFKRWKEKKKTWFGFGKTIEIDRSCRDKLVPKEGSVVTTTQKHSTYTRYYGEGSRGYQGGGGNYSIRIKQSPEEVLNLIEKAESK